MKKWPKKREDKRVHRAVLRKETAASNSKMKQRSCWHNMILDEAGGRSTSVAAGQISRGD